MKTQRTDAKGDQASRFSLGAHVKRRWQNFVRHDSKDYLGLSALAGGVQFARVLRSNRGAKRLTYVARKTAAKLPRQLVYPLVLGVTGVELVVWGAAYWGANTDKDPAQVAHDAKLAPAAFALYGGTLNEVYPLQGRLRRLRGFFRPVKWGFVGVGVDAAISRASRSWSKDQPPLEEQP